LIGVNNRFALWVGFDPTKSWVGFTVFCLDYYTSVREAVPDQ